MKKYYLFLNCCLTLYSLVIVGCGKSGAGTAPLYSITAATYTENQVDYLKITLTYLSEDVYEPMLIITDPDNNTTTHEYFSSSSGRILPSLEPWSIDGISKIAGNWHFEVKGCKDFGSTVCFDSERDLTVN